jgi:N-acetylmuramoyl-L-alanine amidase CwlA
LIPKPSKRRSGLPISNVRFLVAHDTGNEKSTAAQNVQYYINSCKEESASAHLFVDDKEILECIPALNGPPEKAWHVLYNVPKDNELYGCNANDAAIGVEYCFGGNIDPDKAYAKYIWVLAKLCFVHGLDPSKDITGHFFLDPQRKTDPVTGLAKSRRTYDQLLKDIELEYQECTGNQLQQEEVVIAELGTVKVTVKLNLRTEPNKRAAVVEVLPANTVVKYDAKTNNGEVVNNNSLWYRDTKGNWFWSGGVVVV